MFPEQMNAMTGFTADFFGALQTTFTDRSQNNSRCDLSQSFANKSQLFREIREESVAKIHELIEKMVKEIVFESIFVFGLRKKRKEERTPLNMHKHAYKIELMINMKTSAKTQWAFYRMAKFTQQFNMREIVQKNNSKNEQQIVDTVIQKKEIKETSPIVQVSNNKISQKEIPSIQKPVIEVKRNQGARVGTLDNSISMMKDATPLCQIFLRLFTDRRQLQYGMARIREYEHYVTKKSYIFQIIGFLVNKAAREAFIQLLNVRSQIKKQQPIKSQSFELNNNYLATQRVERQSKHAEIHGQPYGLEQNIRFKKIAKKAKKEEKEPASLSNNKNQKKSIRPGALKFNRCSKKKIQPGEQKQKQYQQMTHSIYEKRDTSSSKYIKKQEIPLALKVSKIVKILVAPSMKIKTQIDQFPLQRLSGRKQFTSFKKTYYLPPQELKQEVADISDQMITFESDLKNSKCSSRQKGLTFSSIHKIDNKLPLEFSNKKHKNKFTSSQKSKKSLQKSEEDQPETFNVQSIKSYYFPEVQKFGKAEMATQRQISTNFLGSSKWNGSQPKKRVSTQVIIKNMKSNEKINPYLHELKEKIKRKQSERVISLNKMVERSLSARSNSRNSKGSRDDKKHENNHLIKNVQNYKNGKVREKSPQLFHEASRTPQPGVPKQWNFYQSNVSNLGSPTKNLKQSNAKPSVQFQKLTTKNSRK